MQKLQAVVLMEVGKELSGQSSGGTKKERHMMVAKVSDCKIMLVYSTGCET